MSQAGQEEKVEARAEQDTFTKPRPQKEHEWLNKLVGEWTYQFEMPSEAGKPPSKITGTQRMRSLGGLWVLGEGRSEMPGSGSETMVITLGYDPDRKRFVGTWIGSMMANLWIYDGELDSTARILTLDSEGPSMSGDGTTAKYQDVIEFTNDDRYVMKSRVLNADGSWQQFMEMEFRRTK